jgi:hypothetical protein
MLDGISTGCFLPHPVEHPVEHPVRDVRDVLQTVFRHMPEWTFGTLGMFYRSSARLIAKNGMFVLNIPYNIPPKKLLRHKGFGEVRDVRDVFPGRSFAYEKN